MGRWITSKFNGKCRECSRPISIGDRVLWERNTRGVICEKCGGQGKGNSKSPKPVSVKLEKPVNPLSFTIDWADVKEVVRAALKGAPLKLRAANERQIISHTRQVVSWHGYTAGQLERWVDSGFQTEVIKGLAEFTPLVRDKRRLRYMEEGDEFHADLAMSGDENFMSSWTKRQIIPGVSLEIALSFSALVNAEIVNAYNVWVCRSIYSLESAGIDCEVNIVYTAAGRLIQGISDTTQTKIRVKKEGETSDFVSISPMLSPAAFRTFMFAANSLYAESLGKDVVSGQGRPVGNRWDVRYDKENRKIVVECDRAGYSFPHEEMTRKLRAALQDAMRG